MSGNFLIEKSKFMELAGIKTRARFNQVVKGWSQTKNGKIYSFGALLIEDVDYKYLPCCECGKETIYFTKDAVKKVLSKNK